MEVAEQFEGSAKAIMTTSSQVLVVDDSDHMRILVSRLLKQRGFEHVEMAVNGKLGLESVKTHRPDLVFLDAVMPEMGGLEVLREIKKESPGTVVVIMSSISAREEILQFKEAGADHYLLKPFETGKFDEALKKITALLDSHKKE
jgi:two-component system chemotaxis response regulator CheY